jgi:hypothetical protein
VPDDGSDERFWVGPGRVIEEHWFPIPPDLPSLEVDEIRAMFEQRHADEPLVDGGFRRLEPFRLVDLAVHRESPLPAVRTFIRIPENDRYMFIGAIILPLAECSWVIKVMSPEGRITGVRETLAADRLFQEHPGASHEDLRASHFNPYDEQWDIDEWWDPMTVVRRSTMQMLASLEVDPQALEAARFA